MDVAERVLTCRLIENIEQDPMLGKKLGLRNASRYRGKLKKIDKQNRKRRREDAWQEKPEVTVR